MTNRLGILLLEFATLPADATGVARLTPATIGPGYFHILVVGADPAATAPRAGLSAWDNPDVWPSSAVWGNSAGWGGSTAWVSARAPRAEN